MSAPFYLLDEQRLRANLSLIRRVADEAGVEIILAFKAYALWRTFHIFREYIRSTTASSLYEARLGYEEFGAPVHTFSPAYTDEEIGEIARRSSHLTFNSLTQYERYGARAVQANEKIKLGLRLNPGYSEIETDLYNPCAPGSRFGVTPEQLRQAGILPTTSSAPTDKPLITGFHIHNHCESSADALQRSIAHVEEVFGEELTAMNARAISDPSFEPWLNLGGGHLMTRKDYDIELLISTLRQLRERYPKIRIILEPGSAFGWQTGDLVSEVVDIVENSGIRTAILNVSFTCHMPDCLEMPYKPAVHTLPARPTNPSATQATSTASAEQVYRLGGNSCLSGDFIEDFVFDHELQVGEQIVFEDMLHYTTVKTNMFNGIGHPAIALRHVDGSVEMLREYTYEDYKARMD